MGFFSWNCRACGKSVRSAYTNAGHGQWMAQAVVATKSGSIVKGEYDGYGRVGDREFDLNDAGPFTIWHLACWDGVTAFAGQSESAGDQGHFCDEVLTLFPPGHDPAEVRRRHVSEVARILAEIAPVLPSLGLKAGYTFETVAFLTAKESEKNRAEMIKKLRDER